MSQRDELTFYLCKYGGFLTRGIFNATKKELPPQAGKANGRFNIILDSFDTIGWISLDGTECMLSGYEDPAVGTPPMLKGILLEKGDHTWAKSYLLTNLALYRDDSIIDGPILMRVVSHIRLHKKKYIAAALGAAGAGAYLFT